MSKEKNIKKRESLASYHEGYLWNMSMAPKIDEQVHWFQMLPAAFFTAIIILITFMGTYERNMSQFFWSDGESSLADFFSYYKSIAILVTAVFVIVLLLYRVFSQSLFIKKTWLYIPMLVYAALVTASYIGSDHKDIALYGWNDRFEGTLVLLSYMLLLFYIINSVNNEKGVKWIVYSVAGSSVVLGLLGVTQALDMDFLQTNIGKKLITPAWYAEHLDKLTFTFKNKEIYQTVFNINYVSFYLTLLIPLFGLIFIYKVMKGKEEKLWKKLLWGGLFGLALFNLIGSASSGGLFGMAVAVAIAIVVLNKRLIQWIKPIALLLAITVIIGGATYERWFPEFSGAMKSAFNIQEPAEKIMPATPPKEEAAAATKEKTKIDHLTTKDNTISLGINGDVLNVTVLDDEDESVHIADSSGALVPIKKGEGGIYDIDDERFSMVKFIPTMDEAGNTYIILKTDEQDWPFAITENGVFFYNGLGKQLTLKEIPTMGFENNQSFGSGRGYIWSRTFPMMKETLLLGHGADTYCIEFPQIDYVGKYNAGWNLYSIIDKPHNMYMGMWTGTGAISFLALLVLFGAYVVQSMTIYFRHKFDSFNCYAGAGVFLGICGFLAAGIVNDSSVSVMPLFYGLLGTGIAINLMLKKKLQNEIK